MIDIENIVFTTVSTAVQTAYPSCVVYSDYVIIPENFPCVTLIEGDNKTYRNSQDTSLTEHHAEVMYEVNVYCADKNGKKTKAKKIADIVDTEMQKMMFTRIFRDAIPNTERTIYRITMRYTGIVAEPTIDGTDTTYQMYRR